MGVLVDRLHAERRPRILTMHSQFRIEGLEHGFPAIRSARKRQANPGFDREDLTRPRMDAILREAAQITFDVGMVNVQLIQALPRPTPDARGYGTVAV
jgi:hypothetical protein